MATAREKLEYKISLIDKLSGPSKKLTKSMDKMTALAKRSAWDFAKGGAAVTALSYGLIKATGPAREFNKAMSSVRSLDVSEKELDKLGKAAKRMAFQYGMSATEFVKSSYDIQSSINGLVDGELAKFTTAGNILAKGTMADAGTITDYMGTMYSVFKKQANEMGKGKWVDQMSGKTAVAVKMFKTNGAKMAESFSQLGSDAEKAGVSMSEQMAVMGQLGATMSGSQAATKYKAFLQGIGKAQDDLGVKMTDSHNKMLPITEILENLKKAGYGNLEDVAVADKLKKAFGSKEAASLLKNLIGSTGELKSNIDKLQKVKGLGPAIKMAKTQVDPLEQLSEGGQALLITIGKIISVGLNPIIKGITYVAYGLDLLIDAFPPLRWGIGLVVAAISTFVAAWGVMKIALGIQGMIKTVVGGFRILNICLIKHGIYTRNAALGTKAWAVAVYLASGAMKVLKLLTSPAVWLARKALMYGAMIATKLWTVCQWALNVAMNANPIGLIIMGIAALIFIGHLLYKNWDTIINALSDAMLWMWNGIKAGALGVWNFIKKYGVYVLALVAPVIGIPLLIWKHWDTIMGWLKAGWDGLVNGLTAAFSWCGDFIMDIVSSWCGIGQTVWDGISWIWDAAKNALSGVSDFFNGIINGMVSFALSGIKWILEKVAMLPLIGGKAQAALEVINKYEQGVAGKRESSEKPAQTLINKPKTLSVPAGGVQNTYSNDNSKSVNISGVTINAEGGMGPAQLEEWGAMA